MRKLFSKHVLSDVITFEILPKPRLSFENCIFVIDCRIGSLNCLSSFILRRHRSFILRRLRSFILRRLSSFTLRRLSSLKSYLKIIIGRPHISPGSLEQILSHIQLLH